MSGTRTLVLGFFFLSGLCGLVYEVVWIRTAGTAIGNTTYAVGTVIGVYMAGLALGAWWGGRAADRRSGSRLVALYAQLEVGVAVSALAVPLALAASEPFMGFLWRTVGDIPAAYAALRVLLVALVLIAPTTFMGATLPVLARYFSESDRGPAREAGRAYAVNTFGGVAGVLLAGFWMLPTLGLRLTTLAAAGLNLSIAAAAFALSRGAEGQRLRSPAASDPPDRLALLVAAVTGFAALVYEVAWTRSIVLSIGSTVFAFSLILTAFILGLAAGSGLSARFLTGRVRPLPGLVATQVTTALLAVALLPFLGDLPVRMVPLIQKYRSDYSRLLLVEFGWTALIVFAPALVMGMVFPLTCRLALKSGEAVGRSVGAVYSWNTLGSIAGTLAATFVLVPTIGLSNAIRFAACVNFGLAAVLMYRASPKLRKAIVLPVLAGALLWLVPEWNPKVMASGLFLYGSRYDRAVQANRAELVRQLEAETEIVARYQDSYGLVTVHRDGEGVLSMRINGKVDASDGMDDMITQLLLGHLPALHVREPRRALVIGLGGGVTLAASARHPFEAIDCVEISDAVVRASRHFSHVNRGVIDDERVRLFVGDGRAAVAFSPHDYDVIVSEPSNLWLSGMANLYTREFFELVSGRLSDGGLFSQWVHAYRLPLDDFRTIVRTFYDVFPHGSVWEVFPGTDYILLGGNDPVRPPWRQVDDRSMQPHVREDLSYPDFPGALGLVGHLVTDREGALAMAGPGPLVTDDRPSIEYSAPRGLYGDDSRPELLAALGTVRDRPVAGLLYEGVDESLAARVTRRRTGRAEIAAAFRTYTEHDAPQALVRMESIRATHGLDGQSRRFLDGIARQVRFDAQRHYDGGQIDGAIRNFLAVPRSSSHFAEARIDLAYVLRAEGREEDAEAARRTATASGSATVSTAIALARRLQANGQPDHAVAAWRDVVHLLPASADARLALARSLSHASRTDEARRACLAALELDPDSAEAARLLGALDP